MTNLRDLKPTSALELLNSVFEQDLADTALYDPEVVELVREHLGQAPLHSTAGARLADVLIALARTRAEELPQ
jgi:hypothetical protein